MGWLDKYRKKEAPGYLSIREFAEAQGVTVNTVDRIIQRGLLGTRKIGGHCFIAPGQALRIGGPGEKQYVTRAGHVIIIESAPAQS